jgi:hypothetical protein
MIERSYDAELVAQNELSPGEPLVWAGRPSPGAMARASLPILIFAIPWTAFAIFWVVMASGITTGATNRGFFILFPLFGLPFVLVGLAMTSAPYWAYRKAQNTIYAITDRRLMIITEGRSKTVQSYDADEIGEITRRERADGSGDLIFARTADAHTDTDGYSRSRTQVGFLGVPDVRTVERYVRELKDRDKTEK